MKPTAVYRFIKVIKVIQIVVVRHENRLTVMPAMNYVVGMIWDYKSCGSWQHAISTALLFFMQKTSGTPLIITIIQWSSYR